MSQEREQLAEKLRCANRIAKEVTKRYLGPKKLHILHQLMQCPGKAQLLGVTPEQLSKINSVPERFLSQVREIPKLAELLYNMHRKFIMKLVNKYASRTGRINVHDIADMESEATVAFLNACRGYSKSFEFLTYAGSCIKRWLRLKGTNKKGIWSKLLIRYNEMEQKLQVEGKPHGFRDVVEEMGLKNKKQIRALYVALGKQEVQGEEENNLEQIEDKRSKGLDYDLVEAISMVSMSSLEAEAWKAWLNDLYPDACGSLREVAEKFDVTPQAANYAKERARKKLEAGLQKFMEEK